MMRPTTIRQRSIAANAPRLHQYGSQGIRIRVRCRSRTHRALLSVFCTAPATKKGKQVKRSTKRRISAPTVETDDNDESDRSHGSDESAEAAVIPAAPRLVSNGIKSAKGLTTYSKRANAR